MSETEGLGRRITVQRGFQIAPYQLLTVTDSITVPEDIAKDPIKLKTINQLLLNNVDAIYFEYMENSPTTK